MGSDIGSRDPADHTTSARVATKAGACWDSRLGPTVELQTAGQALAAAIHLGDKGLSVLAPSLVERLRTRDWVGDTELADTLDELSGRRPVSSIKWLPVNLEELSSTLEGCALATGGRLDPGSGRLEISFAYDDEGEDEDVLASSWIDFEPLPSDGRRSDLIDFAASLADARLARDLNALLSAGRSLSGLDRELQNHIGLHGQWSTFSRERRLGRARAWLAEQGYRSSIPLGL